MNNAFYLAGQCNPDKIIKYLDYLQSSFNLAMDLKQKDLMTKFATDISKIMTWFMKNGYVQS